MNENTKFDSGDFRNILPRFSPEALKANQVLIDLLGKMAEHKNTTTAQIALAWLLAQNRGLFRFRVLLNLAAWKRTAERLSLNSHQVISMKLMMQLRRSQSTGLGTLNILNG